MTGPWAGDEGGDAMIRFTGIWRVCLDVELGAERGGKCSENLKDGQEYDSLNSKNRSHGLR